MEFIKGVYAGAAFYDQGDEEEEAEVNRKKKNSVPIRQSKLRSAYLIPADSMKSITIYKICKITDDEERGRRICSKHDLDTPSFCSTQLNSTRITDDDDETSRQDPNISYIPRPRNDAEVTMVLDHFISGAAVEPEVQDGNTYQVFDVTDIIDISSEEWENSLHQSSSNLSSANQSRRIEGSLECPLCGKPAASKLSRNKHYAQCKKKKEKSSENDLRCECGLFFPSEKSLNDHLHHCRYRTQKTVVKVYCCWLCKLPCKNVSGLKTHLQKVHEVFDVTPEEINMSIVSNESNMDLETDDKVYLCQEAGCTGVFKDLRGLQIHHGLVHKPQEAKEKSWASNNWANFKTIHWTREKATNPDATFGEYTKVLAQAWKDLNPCLKIKYYQPDSNPEIQNDPLTVQQNYFFSPEETTVAEQLLNSKKKKKSAGDSTLKSNTSAIENSRFGSEHGRPSEPMTPKRGLLYKSSNSKKGPLSKARVHTSSSSSEDMTPKRSHTSRNEGQSSSAVETLTNNPSGSSVNFDGSRRGSQVAHSEEQKIQKRSRAREHTSSSSSEEMSLRKSHRSRKDGRAARLRSSSSNSSGSSSNTENEIQSTRSSSNSSSLATGSEPDEPDLNQLVPRPHK